jgi:DNA-binding IclR family transcriptional regulator
MRLGLVVQDTATLQYGLGPYALQLGISALRQISLPEVARAPLERLHLEFELPTYLSLWAKMGPFIALKFDAELPTPFTIKVGYVFPLLTTATGRIFLAHLPNRDTDVLVRREGKIHPDMLAKREAIVAGVRADGIAVSEGALFRGFSALSAPIYDHSHDLAGSVTLLGMGDQVDAMIGGKMVQQVRKTAKEISRAMGATN